MNFKEIQKIDPDATAEYTKNGIVKVEFAILDSHMTAQYDDRHLGLYGFTIEDPDHFFTALAKLTVPDAPREIDTLAACNTDRGDGTG